MAVFGADSLEQENLTIIVSEDHSLEFLTIRGNVAEKIGGNARPR